MAFGVVDLTDDLCARLGRMPFLDLAFDLGVGVVLLAHALDCLGEGFGHGLSRFLAAGVVEDAYRASISATLGVAVMVAAAVPN